MNKDHFPIANLYGFCTEHVTGELQDMRQH